MCIIIVFVLCGKYKFDFMLYFDNGDYVIVINVDKVCFIGFKMDQKIYLCYMGYFGGQCVIKVKELMVKKFIVIVEIVVKGMFFKIKLGCVQYKKLFVYVGIEYLYIVQKLELLEI